MSHLHEKKLKKALERLGTHTIEDLVDAVYDGHMQVFTRANSVLFTQVLDYPRMRVLQLFLAVGDMTDMLDLERQATEYAASIGAKRIQAFARSGWKRSSIRHEAWRASTTLWIKDLT